MRRKMHFLVATATALCTTAQLGAASLRVLLIGDTNDRSIGKSVVTDLADSGPAQWTGKQFGASPEAMKALDLHKGPRKGLVIFLFVDDPQNKIPLGPLSTKINVNSL